MKKLFVLIVAAACLIGCGTTEKQLNERAAELCKHIPDLHQLEQSRDFLTKDFYAVLDTMVNLPEATPLEHQWDWWFVAADDSPIQDCNCEVQSVQKQDATHALATILVHPQDSDYEATDETFLMEKVNGQWLIADYANNKFHATNYIRTSRQEWNLIHTIGDYLVNNIAPYYLQGELCVPTVQLVATDDTDVYGVFEINWYNRSGDTLKTVSGGMHAGRMSLTSDNGKTAVTSFEQTVDGAGNEASAKRIFGNDYYEIYQNIYSNHEIREAARRLQLREYIRRNNLDVRYYQDYGWPAVTL